MLNTAPGLTVTEQRGGADLSDRAFQLETEDVAALGNHTWRAPSLVLQRHHVEV